MFGLHNTECRVTSVSTNPENMGSSGETKLGISIFVEYLASNEELDKFDPKLRSALYEPAISGQEDMTGHLPTPKFKLAKPICWPYIGAGYTAVIHSDLEFSESLELEDCKVDKFQFTINDEGVVGYKLRIYAHPEIDQIGPLSALAKHDVKLSLVPPKVSATAQQAAEGHPQADLLDSANDAPVDAMYVKAVAAVRATNNPTPTALQTELKISFNDAAVYLSRMLDEGVIAQDGDEYVVVEKAAA